MTYKEKYWREHPELTFEQMEQIIKTECPKGIYPTEYCSMNAPVAEACHRCWNQEITAKMKVAVSVGAIIPRRAHKTDAGLDLYATKGGWIFPKCRKTFGTGFHASIPAGFVGLLTSKSGMMQKGITSRGTIDSGYTGEIRAVLFNHSWKFIRIKPNQKITQLVLLPIITPELELVDGLEDTERGNGGFGSTGAF